MSVGVEIATEQSQQDDQQLSLLAAAFGVTDKEPEALMQAATADLNQAMRNICRAGAQFAVAQHKYAASERSDTGQFQGKFEQWIAQNGVAKQRVYEAIRIARFVAALPKGKQQHVLQAGKVKALMLTKIEPEIIEHMPDEEFGEKAALTVKELHAQLKSAQNREANYDAQLEILESQNKRLTQQHRLTGLEPHTEYIRAECLAHQAEAELAIASLGSLDANLQRCINHNHNSPEARIRTEQVWITACTIAARASELIAHMRKHTTGMPERITGEHIMTPAEAERWIEDYRLILNAKEGRKLQRQQLFDATQPRGRGRPKGSTNKAG